MLNLEENQNKLKTTVAFLVERRWELLAQLEGIFSVKPVDEVDFLSFFHFFLSIIFFSSKIFPLPFEQKVQLFKICGLALPNTEYTGFDEEQIASALGYISQAVLSIANYFEVPLRYGIVPASSRSIIKDEISLQNSTPMTQEFEAFHSSFC